MSLVIGFVSPDFIMICGEERIRIGKDIFSEKFRKVYYFNSSIILGIVGKIDSNYKFIEDYLLDFNLLKDEKFVFDYEKTEKINFLDLDKILTKKFHVINNESIKTGRFPNIRIMIGGYINGIGRIKIYSIINDKHGIYEINEEQDAMEYFVLGKPEEQEILCAALETKDKYTINDLREVFQDVIDYASKDNAGINKNMDAVFLRRWKAVEKEKTQPPCADMGDILIGKTAYIKNDEKDKESYSKITIKDIYA